MITQKHYIKKNNTVWKYLDNRDLFIQTNLLDIDWECEILKITPDGKIIIKGESFKPYAWDGCSPKIEVLHLLIGVPDGKLDYRTYKPMTYFASMFHDAIYQYKHEVPISRQECDAIFKIMLSHVGFMWSNLYYYGVRIGGRFFGTWYKKTSQKEIGVLKYSWLD